MNFKMFVLMALAAFATLQGTVAQRSQNIKLPRGNPSSFNPKSRF